jgi:hypothetical protein
MTEEERCQGDGCRQKEVKMLMMGEVVQDQEWVDWWQGDGEVGRESKL